MDKLVSDVERAPAKGRDVLKVGLLPCNSKSADDTCTIEAPQIEKDNLDLIKERINYIENLRELCHSLA